MPTINKPLTFRMNNKTYVIKGHNEMYQWGYDLNRSSGYQKHRQYLLIKYISYSL